MYLAKVAAVELELPLRLQVVVVVDLVELMEVAGAILVDLELVLVQVFLLHVIHGVAILALTVTLFHPILLAAEQLDPMATLVLMP
jgi:hypothetical protein